MTHADMLQLKRWNTPTIYNGWEQITRHDIAVTSFNVEETRDFMPQMGPMVGRAITVVFEPSNPAHPRNNPRAWSEYRRYVASVSGPKIVVVQDLDKPRVVGAFWGEVNSNIHRSPKETHFQRKHTAISEYSGHPPQSRADLGGGAAKMELFLSDLAVHGKRTKRWQ